MDASDLKEASCTRLHKLLLRASSGIPGTIPHNVMCALHSIFPHYYGVLVSQS